MLCYRLYWNSGHDRYFENSWSKIQSSCYSNFQDQTFPPNTASTGGRHRSTYLQLPGQSPKSSPQQVIRDSPSSSSSASSVTIFSEFQFSRLSLFIYPDLVTSNLPPSSFPQKPRLSLFRVPPDSLEDLAQCALSQEKLEEIRVIHSMKFFVDSAQKLTPEAMAVHCSTVPTILLEQVESYINEAPAYHPPLSATNPELEQRAIPRALSKSGEAHSTPGQ